jgi:formiminotetrahydrofolate cyclodeaminase
MTIPSPTNNLRADGGERLDRELKELAREAQALPEAIEQDAKSFGSVMAGPIGSKTPMSEGQRREDDVQLLLEGAAEARLTAAQRATPVFSRLRQLETMSRPSMLSDIRGVRWLAAASVRGAIARSRTLDSAYSESIRSECATLDLQIR